MPELPEVEGYRHYFEKHALGRAIARIDVHDARILEDITPPLLRRRLEKAKFVSAERHGKHLFARASNGRVLHLHFGMSGDLEFSPVGQTSRFARVSFRFADGSRLSFDDARLFGWVAVVDSAESEIARRKLGPDPLLLSKQEFTKLFEGRRGAIKAMLMNQSNIAGLGNLYVDELLYQSAIKPTRPIESFQPQQLALLYSNMKKILKTAMERQRDGRAVPPKWLFDHRELDHPCPRCGGRLVRATVSGRTTYYCRDHQK